MLLETIRPGVTRHQIECPGFSKHCPETGRENQVPIMAFKLGISRHKYYAWLLEVKPDDKAARNQLLVDMNDPADDL